MSEIQTLRDRIDGNDPVETEKLDQLERTLKRAMLTKNFGEHPVLLQLRATLESRIQDCDKVIIASAREIPTNQADILAYAVAQNSIATRKTCYEWFLRLFSVAEQRAEVINKSLGGRKKK